MGKKDVKSTCLCAPRRRGMIDPVIRPECSEQYYQIAGMGCGTTWGAVSRIGKNERIAVKLRRFYQRGKNCVLL